MPNTPEQDKMLAFVQAYWLAQPAPVRAFQKMQNTNPDGTISDARGILALQLNSHGYDIDFPIMVWDWNPYYIMLIRENEGVLHPQYLNGKAIKVSSDIKDYPPLDPPPAPTPSSGVKLVGNWAFNDIYYSTEAGKAIADGGEISEDGGKYRKMISQGLMGATHLFKRVG